MPETQVFVREVYCEECQRVVPNYLTIWKTDIKNRELYVIVLRVCSRCSEGVNNYEPKDFILKVDRWNALISNP